MTKVKEEIHRQHNSPLRRPSLQKEDVRAAIDLWFASKKGRFANLKVQSLELPSTSGVANETWLVGTTWQDSKRKVKEPGPRLVFRLESEEFLYLRSDLRLHYDLYESFGQIDDLPVPTMLAFEEEPEFLGCRFFVMEHVTGRAVPDRPNFNYGGWLAESSLDEQRAVWIEAVTVMARLHAVDAWQVTPLMSGKFNRQGGVQECLDYWMSYSDWAGATGIALISLAADWLASNMPSNLDASAEISWGDARLQNLLFEGTRCAAILDWDMVSLAGAEADLAWWALADHKYTASRGQPRLPGIGSPSETVALWESLSGRKVKNFDWHLVFAAFRQALVSQRLIFLSSKVERQAEQRGEASIGLQWLSCLLDAPADFPITMPFVGLDQ
jgi:aminoglycoside phosphotransferase (APT) family kinase protein